MKKFLSMNLQVGRVTPCAPLSQSTKSGAHGVTRPTTKAWLKDSMHELFRGNLSLATLISSLIVFPSLAQNEGDVSPALRTSVQARINDDYPHLENLYKDLHAHPELSFHEEKTAARIATELKEIGRAHV